MKFFSRICCAALLTALIFNISACGKVSSPSPIEGSGYPHTYPRR